MSLILHLFNVFVNTQNLNNYISIYINIYTKNFKSKIKKE